MEGPREVELKLLAAPDDLRRLQQHPLVRALGRGRAITRQLETVYFDTPDHVLARAGLALRLRRVGSRTVQTLKGGERVVAGGLFERTEIETPVEGDAPDLASLPDPELRGRLAELIGPAPLLPIFGTSFRRTRRVMRNEESEWSLDVDQGELVAGDSREPICELELELREGDPARLFEFALLLHEHFDLLPATRSKAERGYALALGERPAPRTARRIQLAPGANTEAAWIAILSQCLEQIGANADCACEGRDAEGVHQMRVGVRRMRAAFAAFAPLMPREQVRVFRSELRWLGSELGAARDLDVFLQEIAAPMSGVRGDDPAFKRLAEEAVALRADCYERVREVVRSPRYARLVLELGAWIASRGWRNQPLSPGAARLFAPARGFGAQLLDRRQKRIRKLGARLRQSDEARHALRIQLKKLRYSGEFFRALYPHRHAKRFLRRAARLQDALGLLNDVAASERILESLLQRLGAERAPAHDRAAGFVEGWMGHLASRELDQIMAAWEEFEGLTPFWRD